MSITWQANFRVAKPPSRGQHASEIVDLRMKCVVPHIPITSKKRPDPLNHPILIVDHIDHLPFVEGCAGVGDAKRQDIADL